MDRNRGRRERKGGERGEMREGRKEGRREKGGREEREGRKGGERREEGREVGVIYALTDHALQLS